MIKTPAWYDESRLRKAYYARGYSGWVIDLGDGTCRYANNPLLGKNGPKWGDRVPFVQKKDGTWWADSKNIVERYQDEKTETPEENNEICSTEESKVSEE